MSEKPTTAPQDVQKLREHLHEAEQAASAAIVDADLARRMLADVRAIKDRLIDERDQLRDALAALTAERDEALTDASCAISFLEDEKAARAAEVQEAFNRGWYRRACYGVGMSDELRDKECAKYLATREQEQKK